VSRQSYATPLTAVSTDIKEAGGQGAAVGDEREDINGSHYVLCKAAGTITAKACVSVAAGTYTSVAATSAATVIFGISKAAATTTQYHWVQTSGLAIVIDNSSLGINEWAFATTAGKCRGVAMGSSIGNKGSYFTIGYCTVGGAGDGTDATIMITPMIVYDDTT